MTKGFFVTGTDTGVGKTVIAGALIKAMQARGLKACGMKPIETGCQHIGGALHPSDGIFLKQISGMDEELNDITPCRFATSAAPLTASELEGKDIDIDIIRSKFSLLSEKYQAIVVEGLGGILVPIRKDYFVLDLIKELQLPLVVVARPSLGTINHTLLTVNYALKEGLNVAGIIINFNKPPDGTISEQTGPDIIKRLSRVPVIGIFPYLNNLNAGTIEKAASKYLDIGPLFNPSYA